MSHVDESASDHGVVGRKETRGGDLEYRRPQYESARIYSRRGQCDPLFSIDGREMSCTVDDFRIAMLAAAIE